MVSTLSRGMTVLAMVSVLLPVALPTSEARPPNLLNNPNFEEPDASNADVNNIVGWSVFGEPVTRWITTQTPGYFDPQCLKMYGPWMIWQGTGVTQLFPAAAGEVWVAEVYARNDGADPMGAGNFCLMKIEFLDDALGPVGGEWLAGINVFEVGIADENTPLDIWTFWGLGTAPAPAGTAWANMVLVEVQGDDDDDPDNPWTPSGGSVFLDNAYFAGTDDECDWLHIPVFDVDDDGNVDGDDFDAFKNCATGPHILLDEAASQECTCMDRDKDGDIDQVDFAAFQVCFSGTNGTADPACDDR